MAWVYPLDSSCRYWPMTYPEGSSAAVWICKPEESSPTAWDSALLVASRLSYDATAAGLSLISNPDMMMVLLMTLVLPEGRWSFLAPHSPTVRGERELRGRRRLFAA